MFLSVIVAYVIATAFAFCGVVNVVDYIENAQREMGYVIFLRGLAVTMWPLAVASAMVLLIQLACLVEKWMLLWKLTQSDNQDSQASAKPAKQHAAAKTPAAATPATPQASPATTFNQALPAAAPSFDYPAKLAATTPPVLGEATAAPAPGPILSPIPPGMASTPKPLNPTQPTAPPRKAAQQQDGLNFFKLD